MTWWHLGLRRRILGGGQKEGRKDAGKYGGGFSKVLHGDWKRRKVQEMGVSLGAISPTGGSLGITVQVTSRARTEAGSVASVALAVVLEPGAEKGRCEGHKARRPRASPHGASPTPGKESPSERPAERPRPSLCLNQQVSATREATRLPSPTA